MYTDIIVISNMALVIGMFMATMYAVCIYTLSKVGKHD